MGNTVYSSVSRSMSASNYKTKATDDIFVQNKVGEMHESMSPKGLGIREARDSDVHPNTIPIIVALDGTGSMGRIPEEIIKDDLTHLMESLIHDAGIPDIALMFMGVGDYKWDPAPLQVGQFESGDQELQTWLERIWLRGFGGGADKVESYGMAWIIGGKHVALDSMEKRNQKGFLFTIGDEGFDEEYDVTRIFDTPSQSKLSAKAALYLAQKNLDVFHVHANHGSYPNNEHILGQWRDMLGQNLLMAESNKGIIQTIIDTIKARVGKTSTPDAPVVDEEDDGPAPATDDKKPDIML